MKNSKKILIYLFTVALVVLVFASCRSGASATSSLVDIGGTIRNAGLGWAVLNNSAHTPLNIQRVTTDNEKIIIWHNVSAKKVVTFIVTPDETMANQGYTVGISGGLDYSYIYIYDKYQRLVHPKDYKNAGANIWIYGIVQQ